MQFTRGIKALGAVAIATGMAFSGTSAASADSVSDVLGMFNTNSLSAIPSFPPINTDSIPFPSNPISNPHVSIEQQRDTVERDLIRAINTMRRDHNLPIAALDTRLSMECRGWSEYMAYNGFRHATIEERGMTNENILFISNHYTEVGEPSISAWLNSPGHREILLDPNTRAFGVGAGWDGAHGGWMVTYRMYT